MSENKSVLLAISGIKNSGKTMMITQILPLLCKKGLKVATIKHDGHDFTPDIPETDSYKHRIAGAYGAAVFSSKRFMVTKEVEDTSELDLICLFPEADIILLEGFKHSCYPKIELVRQGNSLAPICDTETVIAYVSGLPLKTEKPVFKPEDTLAIADYIYDYWQKERWN